jgi:hypothetical protein
MLKTCSENLDHIKVFLTLTNLIEMLIQLQFLLFQIRAMFAKLYM